MLFYPPPLFYSVIWSWGGVDRRKQRHCWLSSSSTKQTVGGRAERGREREGEGEGERGREREREMGGQSQAKQLLSVLPQLHPITASLFPTVYIGYNEPVLCHTPHEKLCEKRRTEKEQRKHKEGERERERERETERKGEKGKLPKLSLFYELSLHSTKM